MAAPTGARPTSGTYCVSATQEILDERARLGRTTSYTELNAVFQRRTGLRAFRFEDASERASMGHPHGLVVERDFPTRGYMLSALVIYLDGNDAGSGFYALATQMGLLKPGGDKLAFWTEQVNGLMRKSAAETTISREGAHQRSFPPVSLSAGRALHGPVEVRIGIGRQIRCSAFRTSSRRMHHLRDADLVLDILL